MGCGENLKQSCLYSDDSMEEISDEDLDDEDSAASEKLDEISDNDELRLTSTDNDESAPEDGPKATDEDKNKLKSKKKKKEKKKKRRKDEKREKDEKKDKKNKRKELERQIFLAQRITDRDRGRRSRSRDRNRHSSPKRQHWSSRREKTWEEERMEKRMERENLIRERQLRIRLEDKRKEQAKFEVYDKMVNPHLYGGGGYSARRLKKGEHYEDVQKELLENEIRIQTRRARYKHQNNDHQRNHRGSSGPAGGGYHRSDRGHGGRSSWIIAKGGSSRSYR